MMRTIIYPSNNYMSKFLNLYEFEYKLDNNNIYFKIIIERSPNLI
jgi:hypothetical protein